MKKEVLYGALRSILGKSRRHHHGVKKVVAISLGAGLVLMVSCGFLLYLAMGMASDLVADQPDMDLLAMERLIAEKSITLSEEQPRRLAPIIADYTRLAQEILAARIAAFLTWWQPPKPENSAEQLQKTMRRL